MASREPVEAPEGTAARPITPDSSSTSASTVGLPRESRISRATTSTMAVIRVPFRGRRLGRLDSREIFYSIEAGACPGIGPLRASSRAARPPCVRASASRSAGLAPPTATMTQVRPFRNCTTPCFALQNADDPPISMGFVWNASFSSSKARRASASLRATRKVTEAEMGLPSFEAHQVQVGDHLRLLRLRVHGLGLDRHAQRLLRLGLREDVAGVEGVLGHRPRRTKRRERRGQHRCSSSHVVFPFRQVNQRARGASCAGRAARAQVPASRGPPKRPL